MTEVEEKKFLLGVAKLIASTEALIGQNLRYPNAPQILAELQDIQARHERDLQILQENAGAYVFGQGSHEFSEATISALNSAANPATGAKWKIDQLLWDNNLIASCGSLADAGEKMLAHLQYLFPGKADELLASNDAAFADIKDKFARFTVAPNSKEYLDTPFGAAGDVRCKASVVGSKVYFYKDNLALRRIIRWFGADPARFRFTVK